MFKRNVKSFNLEYMSIFIGGPETISLILDGPKNKNQTHLSVRHTPNVHFIHFNIDFKEHLLEKRVRAKMRN
jgi:hypothetical protein